MDYFENLNAKQKEAVLCTEGPLLIIAGAGSGKTTTMTRRIAYLIGEKGVKPYNILAVTFTNKAANEMRERIESLVGVTPGMWVMTFHAMCLRILRAHIDKLGYGKDFTIYDTADRKTVIKKCLADLEIGEKFMPVNYAMAVIGGCKNKGMSPEVFAATKNEAFDPKGAAAAEVYEAYEKTLRHNNALDFDDLLLKTVELFEDFPEVAELYSDRFRYIMIDEYQDTNHIQYRLVKALADKHKNVCAVGDEDQCIYQWRGADITNILNFEKDYPGAVLIKLEQNYRSDGNILSGANSVIKNNRERKGKVLWTDRGEGEKIRVYRAPSDKDEAFRIGREISKFRDKGMSFKDMAILYRTHAQSRIFEEAFSRLDIAYRVVGGTRFYDRKEIKDIVCYLRFIQNQKDDLAFKRIINEPKRGVGDKSVEKLEKLAEVSDSSIFEVISEGDGLMVIPAKASEGTAGFMNLILSVSDALKEKKLSEVYDMILADSGYMQALIDQNTIEAQSRIENLLEFKSVIYDFEEKNPEGTLEEFMEKTALMTDVDNHDPSEDAVSLMTLHSAKGLEFPVVFMPGMEQEIFPGRGKQFDEKEVEEERRLCYVGMTRAKECLIMSSAARRLVFGRLEERQPSCFIDEIDKDYVEYYDEENGFRKVKNQINSEAAERTFRGGGPGFLQKKPVEKAVPAGEQQSFKGGERVKHKKFGEGLVVGVSGTTLTIIFDRAGTKMLDAGLARLEVL